MHNFPIAGLKEERKKMSIYSDINADLQMAAACDTGKMDWLDTPRADVWRKPLERIGGEMAARATTLVRYGPGASFHGHDHPQGEEILVLGGVFSDEHGDYPAGTWLANPPGFAHAPFSRDGCEILVKLCQYGGEGRQRIVTDTLPWQRCCRQGTCTLFDDPAFPEKTMLRAVTEEAVPPAYHDHDGVELYILDGVLRVDGRRYGPGCWLRRPPGSALTVRAEGICRYYEKRNHLPPPENRR